MTKKEKKTREKNNELIAKFCGWENRGSLWYLDDAKVHPDGYYGSFIDRLRFHSNWTYLMPIVEYIETLKITHETNGETTPSIHIEPYCIRLVYHGCMLSYIYSVVTGQMVKEVYNDGEHSTAKDKKDAIYKVVIEFIKWYNAGGFGAVK